MLPLIATAHGHDHARALLAQALGAFFTAAVSFLLLAALARVFGPSAFGDYAALLSTAVVALIVIEGGWSTRVYRTAVHDPATRADSAHAVAWVAGIACAFALAGALAGAPAAAMAFACMGLVALCNLASARMRGHGRFALEAAWQASARAVSALAILAAVLFVQASSLAVFAAWALSLVVVLAVGARWLAPPRWAGLGAAAKLALPFLAIDGCLVFLLRADLAVLKAAGMSGETLSWYAAATRFVEAGVLLFAPVSNVLLRSLALRRDDAAGFRRVLGLAVAAAVALALGGAVASVAVGEPVMRLVFGPAYAAGAAVLPWLAIGLAPMLVSLVLVQALVARGNERDAARVLMCGCALLALALALGASQGMLGAAIAALSAHAAIGVALTWCLRRGGGVA